MKSWRIIFAAALIAMTCLLRGPGLDKKIWNVDEAVTFTMAEQILHDGVPYRDGVDQRPPLAPYAQAAVFAVAGEWNLHAQHVVLAVMIGLTAVLLWSAARRLGDETAGVAGALWFTVLALVLPSVRDTMPAHTAWYLVFFSAAGFWALAQAWTSGRPGWAVAAGAAFGLSFLAKQPGVLDFGVALVLVALAILTQPARRGEFGRLALALLVGFTAPVLLTGIYFAAKGAWADLVYYTWTYNNTLYVPEIPRLERWQTMRVPFALLWDFHPAVVVIGVLAAVGLLGRAVRGLCRRPAEFDLTGWMILGWSAAGLISTTLSGRGFTHYSIQLIPGLSLACGWLTSRVWTASRDWAGPRPFRRAFALIAGAGLAVWLLLPVPARIRAFNLPEPGSDTIAQLVRRHVNSAEKIFIWGYTPEIYAISERLPATRFLYNTFVTGMIPWTNLDLLKNTDYAVVPGAREQFLADWKSHPPALVADGRTQRGFMKYPLEKQAWLWPLIERDYAEVETGAAAELGFWLFRRCDPVTPQPLPASVPVSSAVQVEVPAAKPGQAARVAVQTPADITWLELYFDGVRYRRLPCPGDKPNDVAFAIPADDWKDATHRVQVVAGNASGRLASVERELRVAVPSMVIGGPPLEFDGRTIAALESSTITGGPQLPKKDAPSHWDAHAPSRVVYPWLPGMNSLAFAYGIEAAALAREPPNHTDGVEVVVQTEDQAGHLTQVYRFHFDREIARRAGGQTVGYTPLPKGGPGRIILLMTPGPDNAPAFDWSYWRWIRADRAVIALTSGERSYYPIRVAAATPPRQIEFNGRFITVTEAPAAVDFASALEFSELSGSFGLLDEAWTGEAKTGPVEFAVTLLRPDGTATSLFTRELDPVNHAGDRGAQEFKFRLTQPGNGTLRFSARPRGRPVNAQAFWSGLQAVALRTFLLSDRGPIAASPHSTTQYGFDNTMEDGRPCLFAHAPAALIYDWHEGMNHVAAEFGLISGAYTNGRSTEGVVFTVETEDAAGHHHELFRRHLDPSNQAADRGVQRLDVPVPPIPGGRLILRTAPPASGAVANAWSYWRDARVGP